MLYYFGFADKKIRKVGGTQFGSDENASDNWMEVKGNHKFHNNDNIQIIHDHYPFPSHHLLLHPLSYYY